MKTAEENITEFRGWLLLNRTSLQNALRKYKAAKSYLVTLSVGCIIFAVHGIYKGNANFLVAIVGVCLLTIILLFSGKIAELLSGLKGFKNLPAHSEERGHHWLSTFPSLIGETHLLLKNIYVKKAVKDSSKKKINAFIFFNALVCISDAVREEVKAPE